MASNTKILRVVVIGDSGNAEKALKRVGGAAQAAEGKTGAFGRAVHAMGTKLKFAGGILAGFALHAGVKTALQIDKAKRSFTNMIGSVEGAEKHLKDLREFAKSTPFDFPDLVQASQKLQAFGFSAEEVIPMLTGIGDAAAASGIGSEGINRITLALGQMKAKGKVSGEELRQLTEANIPAVQYLADAYGVTTQEMYKMVEKGIVPADEGIRIIMEGMEKGSAHAKGYGGMMAQQAQSIEGRWENLKDTFTLALADMVLALEGPIKFALQALSMAVQIFATTVGGLTNFFKEHKTAALILAGALVFLTGVTIAHTIAMKAQAAGGFVKFLTEYAKHTKIVTGITKMAAAAQWALNAAHLASPIGIVVLAIVALIGILVALWFKCTAFRKALIAVWNAILAGAKALVGWFVGPFVQGMIAAWQWIVNAAKGVAAWFTGPFTNAMTASWNWIVGSARAVGDWFAGPFVGFFQRMGAGIVAAWDWIYSKISGVVNFLRTVITGYIQVWVTVIKVLMDVLTGHWGRAWQRISDKVGSVVKHLMGWVLGTIRLFTGLVKGAVDWLAGMFGAAWQWISDKVGSVVHHLMGWVRMSIQGWAIILKAIVDWLAGAFGAAWQWISDKVGSVVHFFMGWVRLSIQGWTIILKAIVDWLAGAFGAAWQWISDKVGSVVHFFTGWVLGTIQWWTGRVAGAAGWLWGEFAKFFDWIGKKVGDITGGIVEAFRRCVEGVRRFWDGVVGVVKHPANILIDFYNNGIAKIWNFVASKIGMGTLGHIDHLARGGIIPGYSPGKDTVPAMLSPGEGVAVPELVRQIGPERFLAWNRAARNGQSIEGYQFGGIVKLAKGAWHGITGAAGKVKDKAEDLILGSLIKVLTPLINAAKGTIGKVFPDSPEVMLMFKRGATYLLDEVIRAIRDRDVIPGGARWGGKRVEEISRWLKAQDRKPYVWASAGPGGYDCSGIVSAVWNLVMGRNPHSHTFSTHSMGRFFKGKPGGIFTVGWGNPGERGGGNVGHTAGVWNGIPFESGGSHGNVSVGHGDVTPVASFAHQASLAGAEKRIGAKLLQGGGALGSWIDQALRILKLPFSWAGPLRTLIMRESGGNPRAQNNWDINAAHGDPSRGLMQTIGATFSRYRLRSLPNNIFDPIANIVAGLRYIQDRYGSIFNVQQAVGATPAGYDRGGWLEPGWTLAYNGTGRRERVSAPGEGAGIYVDKLIVNVTGDLTPAQAKKIAKEVRNALVSQGNRNGGAIYLPAR